MVAVVVVVVVVVVVSGVCVSERERGIEEGRLWRVRGGLFIALCVCFVETGGSCF